MLVFAADCGDSQRMKATLVQSIEGQLIASEFAVENIEAAMSVRGYTFTGYNFNPRQRAELQGLPMFAELAGPMYDGAGRVRYEDSRANAQLSA